MDCLFCKIANKEIQSYIIYEDPLLMAVLDINPAAPGNTLVFTKKHYSNIYEIPQEEFLHLVSLARAIGFGIKTSLNAKDVDIIYSKEINKGSIIPHALITLLPRYENDANAYVFKRETNQNLSEIQKIIVSKLDEIKKGEKEERQQIQQENKLPTQKEEGSEEKKIEIKRKVPIA
jgi:histidine triad (HIT) family protein